MLVKCCCVISEYTMNSHYFVFSTWSIRYPEQHTDHPACQKEHWVRKTYQDRVSAPALLPTYNINLHWLKTILKLFCSIKSNYNPPVYKHTYTLTLEYILCYSLFTGRLFRRSIFLFCSWYYALLSVGLLFDIRECYGENINFSYVFKITKCDFVLYRLLINAN